MRQFDFDFLRYFVYFTMDFFQIVLVRVDSGQL